MTDKTSPGDRIAKVIARAGLASRREAERMVTNGRVAVNGRKINDVARNIKPQDKVTVDGKPLPEAEGARLWLYHKPSGLVVSEKDEDGRPTVFDALRPELGRVISVGRLDLNSEGLLLLTNDGGLKRRLELPKTGWLRRYRVRVNGAPDEVGLQRLRDGIRVDDETGQDTFAPMQVTLDRQQGANTWLTVGLREGRNREIRRAMAALGLYVNRLIRVSYGPFQLGTLASGAVEEVRPKVLADQLGGLWEGRLAEARRASGEADGATGRKPKATRSAVPKAGRPAGQRRAEKASQPDRPRTAKAPVSRGDSGKADRPTRAERKAAARADPSVSLRKGGRRRITGPKKKGPPKGR